VKFTEWEGPISTLKIGAGVLWDAAAFDQDRASEEQLPIDSTLNGFRDARIFLRGKFKTRRPLTWTFGYMYDGLDDAWRFRQTGIQIGVPEAKGNLFIGRTKEGYSMIKVMTGYNPPGMERSETMDAFVPILADGLKWMGYFPEHRVFFSLGVFGDELSEDEKFATYDHQVVTRVGWVPVFSEEKTELLHVAVMARGGRPDQGKLQVRSRPESNLAPYFLDTGKFDADRALTTGLEAYYRRGPWLIGGEYNWQEVDATSGETPRFNGGNLLGSWLIGAEPRRYNAPGGFFEAVSPERPIWKGGFGAFEAVFIATHTDFDSGSFQGGEFWRVTPMVNWYLDEHIRIELNYGYGELDRFGLDGHTQFLQTRIQLVL
jgi:phosphate-selective porin OprO/OprP